MKQIWLTAAFLLPSLVLLMPAHAAEAGDAAHGKRLFGLCAGCHSTTGMVKSGPSLAGVFGRKAGSLEGFAYTKALQGSGLTWDTATLDTFLASPRTVVPGTSMVIQTRDAQDRADIIAYLRSLPPPASPDK